VRFKSSGTTLRRRPKALNIGQIEVEWIKPAQSSTLPMVVETARVTREAVGAVAGRGSRCRAASMVLVMPRFSKRLQSMDMAISFAEARLEHNKALCMLSVHPSHAVELILLGTSFLPVPSVTFAMTIDAKRYQVVHQIAAEPASGFYVMDL
jgi:hypothetical protein